MFLNEATQHLRVVVSAEPVATLTAHRLRRPPASQDGALTFTLSFSESMSPAFESGDITVAGGTLDSIDR